MGRIDEDGNPRPAGGLDWGRIAVEAFCFTAMYSFGFYCGQSSRPTTAVDRPAVAPAVDNFAAVVERTVRAEAANRASARPKPADLINVWVEASCPEHVIDLEEAIRRGRALSERLGCYVRLSYRGKKVLVGRGMTDLMIARQYAEDGGR